MNSAMTDFIRRRPLVSGIVAFILLVLLLSSFPMVPETKQAVVDETLVSRRFSALLLGLFAAVALTLAAVGIYSVLSYIVRGRSAARTEMGLPSCVQTYLI